MSLPPALSARPSLRPTLFAGHCRGDLCAHTPGRHPERMPPGRSLAWALSAALALLAAGCAAPNAAPNAATTASPPAATARALAPNATSTAATAARPTPPRLLVFLVVDGLPMRQVTGYLAQLAPDGLARFLDRGAWFADAHYGHSYTVTAAGHATMLTGSYPQRSGIIGNEWRHPVTGEAEYCTADASARYIGQRTERLDGTSPKNLLTETVGDVLRRARPGAKVVSVSGKDRGAILPAGLTGTAYMYMKDNGQFASSTHYMAQHPAWVDAFNAARPADRYFKAEWKALLPEAAYAGSLPDDQPWFSRPDGRLPMRMQGAPWDERLTSAFYGNLLVGPFGDALTLDFARAALAGESLGQDDTPDILSISLSGHDYVNHAFSAESRLSHDHLLQLDRLFQGFFRHLDATVGKDRYLLVLTADHGFMPAPEVSRAQGLDAGRTSSAKILTALNAGLAQRFGVAKLAAFTTASGIAIDRQALAQRGLDADAVHSAARDTLLADPAIAAAYTRRELQAGTRPGAPHFQAMQRTWHAERSADVQYVLKPHWMTGSNGATHGSPHAYDTHVPILFYGPPWIAPGRVGPRVDVVDIAPTLADLLGVPVPAGAQGRLLPLPAN